MKLSGEVLLGNGTYGIDDAVVSRIAEEIAPALDANVRVAVVIGGGNIFRGMTGVQEEGMTRAIADGMGMLATVMNALALKDGFRRKGVPASAFAAEQIGSLVPAFSRDAVLRELDKGRVAILAGGTGNPYFTTDTAAVLRALETDADILLKGTKVDGVYSADPVKVADAKRYERITFDDVLAQGLRVMDRTAFSMAKENALAIRVFDMTRKGNITRALLGETIGTIVTQSNS